MAELSWCLESCFAFHQWCLTRLPRKLLKLYCDGYVNLWRQNKINALLIAMQKISVERNLLSNLGMDSPLLRLTHLSQSGDAVSANLAQSHHLASSSIPSRRSAGPHFVCLTYPAEPNSQRVCRLLNELAAVGSVSVESATEHACVTMRSRMLHYLQRVLNVLDETKRGAIFLVGFGTGSILVLLAVLRLYASDARRERTNLAGVICLGIPLVGLKGPRGGQNDPLLNLPELPLLLLVGSNSRLGGRKQALYFRRQLLTSASQRPTRSTRPRIVADHVGDQHASDLLSNQSASDTRRLYTVGIVTIGGADHLLRMRPSACERWCTTQEAVDKRIVSAIERFVHNVERIQPTPPIRQDFSDSDGPLMQAEFSRTSLMKPNRNPSPQLMQSTSPSPYHSDGALSQSLSRHTQKANAFLQRTGYPNQLFNG